MSKKKNTLKDLDEFLKQQAATLVEPTALRDKIETTPESVPAVEIKKQQAGVAPTSAQSIVTALHDLSNQEGSAFRKKFYDIIIETIGKQGATSPEDKMLINTALYLKGGDRWKEVIKDYWRTKD